MSDQPYCPRHTKRVEESGVKRFYFDTFVITHVVGHHVDWLAHPEWCYLCKSTENQFVYWMKKAVELEAKVEAGDGSYTTDKLSVFSGGTESDS